MTGLWTNLDNYFNQYNIRYTNNYDLGTSKICKIPELCILFIIYFNYSTNKGEYNIFFIEDKTLKVMLDYSVVTYDKMTKPLQ